MMMVIILLVTMVFSALIVDTSRINMARSMVSSAGDLAVNSALANYDTVLKDVYGLFAMSQAQSSEELNQEIRAYFEKTLVSYGVTSEAEAGDYVSGLMQSVNALLSGTAFMEPSNFLDMEVGTDFMVTKVDASGLNNPEILRKQIVDYMKYRAPVNMGLSFLDSVKAFTTVSDQTQVVKAQVEAQQSLQSVTQMCRNAIDSIRAYDDKVLAIDSGDQAVTGRDASTDPAIVRIKEYYEQLDKYKQIWGENYSNINELVMVFLLKPPGISDRYLANMNLGNGEYFIQYQTMRTSGSGITVEVELAEDYETAESQCKTQIQKLQGDSYMNLQQAYKDAHFLSEGNLNVDKSAFTNQAAAIEAFMQYEAFLLNDVDKVSITYTKVADILEQLCILEKYQSNYLSLMEQHITARTRERDIKALEVSQKQTQVEQAQKTLDDANKAKDAVGPAKTAWDNAVTASLEAKDKLTAAQNDLAAYNGDTTKKAYKDLQKAVADAQAACDEAQTAEADAQKAYESAKAAEPSAERLVMLVGQLAQREGELALLELEHKALEEEVSALESTKKNNKSQYDLLISKYEGFTSAYQSAMMRYRYYQETAGRMIAHDAAAIQAQALEIRQNVKSLTGGMDKIKSDLKALQQSIKDYNIMVGAWEQENTKYVEKNSADTFSKQNEADIAVTDSEYNEKSLEDLLAYVEVLGKKYQEFYSYVINTTHYRYGTVRVDAMSTSEQVISAIPAGIREELPDIVTPADAAGRLDTLYPQEPTPDLDIEQVTFVRERVLPIQFLKYLNENFPEEAHNITTDSADGNPKEQYDSLKEQMKQDKEGKDKIDSVDTGGYGYTFQDRGVLDVNQLPSYGKPTSTSSPASMSIDQNSKGEVNATSGLEKQNSNLGNVLGGVGDVLMKGVENVYIIDYIFENFSYNTLVQDMVVKEAGYTTYPQVMNLVKDEKVASCRGTARTLSNYNITGANNYLYGAEIEYILWGNKNPKTNVTYTKGSIYAIRFAFNSIYAFTSSEIRNATRAVGLAVQAATVGVVPYQVVQIVLQLALAAAESAVDLDMMSKGLKVVVVKTKDTWTMSMSGAVGLMKDAATAFADNVIKDAIGKATGYINEGINTVIDASADELSGAVTKLTNTVSNAANSKGQEIVDGIYTELQSEVDKLLNELDFLDYSTIETSREKIDAQVASLFASLKDKVEGIAAKYAGNPIADELIPKITNNITQPGKVIDDIHDKITDIIDTAYENASEKLDIGSIICDSMQQIRYDIIKMMQKSINDLAGSVQDAAKNSIEEVKGELQGYLDEIVSKKSEELEEKLVSEAKDKIVASLDNFSNKFLSDVEKPDINVGAGGTANLSTGSKLAAMVKFGYKDYLMLMMFIKVCANDEAVLGRTADIIQLNIQNATGKPDQDGQTLFVHKQGKDFRMSEAKTYVTVQGSVKLDMLFLDMDFFNRLLVEEGTDIGEEVRAVSTIPYKGIAGY